MDTANDRVELPVYTSIFRLRRRLYRVYDIDLPVPVSFAQVTAFVAAFVVMLVVLRALGVDPSPGSAWAYLVPPGAAAWVANRPIGDDRSVLAWAVAHARYAVEPRVLTAAGPSRRDERCVVRLEVWQRSPRRRERPRSGA